MKAFTLIEVLIYTAITAVVGGLMVGILLSVSQVHQRESASTEVTGQLNFVTQTIGRLVRTASNIEITAGVSTSTIKLRMQDSTKDPTYISLVDGVIKLTEGTAAASDLTNTRVIVNALNFKKFVQYPGHDTVSYDVQMTYNSQNPKAQVQRSLSSAIARVSAATFDSNLLPGNTTYEIGQVGSSWSRAYLNDGTAANPSYTFANNTGLGLFRAGANILGFTTAGLERMTIDSSGNVGIGTTTPGAKLEVNGGLTVSAGNTLRVKYNNGNPGVEIVDSAIKIYGDDAIVHHTLSAGAGAAEKVLTYQGASLSVFRMLGNSGTDGTTNPIFDIYKSDGITNVLSVLGNGNVGIGTTNPFDILHVAKERANNGTDNLAQIVISGSGATNDRLLLGYNTTADNGFIQSVHNALGYTSLLLNPNGGNVGIGTTEPGAKLDVAGTVQSEAILKIGTAAPTTYKISTKKYIVEAPPSVVGTVIPLDNTIMNELCRDKDGCTLVIQMINWATGQPNSVASRDWKLFLAEGSNWWRFADNDTTSLDNDGGLGEIAAWDCYFTDADTTPQSSRTDNAIGFSVFNCQGCAYSDTTVTCRYVFED